MNKRKVKKLLLWSGGVLAVLLVAGYFAFNQVTNYLLTMIAGGGVGSISSVITADQSGEGDPKSGQSGLQPENAASSAQGSGTVDSAKADAVHTGTPEATAAPDGKSASRSAGTPAEANASADSAAAAAKQPITASPATGKGKYDGNISVAKSRQAEASISLKDKTEVASILLKKLSPSDIQLFMKMAGNGVTLDEKKAAKKLILQKLTEDEYNQLIAIAAKLGLSQGKDYRDSLKEFPEPSASAAGAKTSAKPASGPAATPSR